jgi:hypothetical protein
MNKRKNSINAILNKFMFDTSILDYDLRIIFDVDGRSRLQLLSIGGNPDFNSHWYDVLKKQRDQRINMLYPATIKARNICNAFLKQQFNATTTYIKARARGNESYYLDEMSFVDQYGAGDYIYSDSSYTFTEHSFKSLQWEWKNRSSYDEEYQASSDFYDFIHKNVSQSVICEFLAYRQNEKHFIRNLNFLDVSKDDPAKLSYITKDRYDKIEGQPKPTIEVYNGKRRFHTKPSKAIRKLFINPDRFTSQDYEIFTRRWNLKFVPNQGFSMKVINSEDIPKYYNYRHHHSIVNEGSSPLSGSCMRNCPESYFEIYAENCDGMLIMADNNNKYIGRALLWTMDCGTKIMDRVYYSSEDVQEAFFQYASDNNLTRKRYQSHSEREAFVTPTGDYIEKNYTKTLKSMHYDEYPYADTFTFKEENGNKLTNDDRLSGMITLISLEGRYEEDESNRYCDCCDTHYNEDEGRYCENEGIDVCDNCAEWSEVEQDNISDSASYVMHHLGDRIFTDNAIYSEHHGHYIHCEYDMDDYKEVNGDWIENDSLVFSNTMDEWLIESDATEIETMNGESDWMPSDSTVWSDSLSAHIIESDAQQDSNGNWVYELNEDEDETTK